VHDAEIIHHGSQTVAKLWGAKVNIEVYKAQHNFIRKNLGTFELFLHRSFLTGLLLVRQLRLQILRLFNKISPQDFSAGMDFLRQAVQVQLFSPPVDRQPRMQVAVEAKTDQA
jgi:hypothetical protein